MKNSLDFVAVSRLLSPDFEKGKLFWMPRPLSMFRSQGEWRIWNLRYARSEAFTSFNGNGYLRGSINGKKYLAHRVIWLLHTGEWPSDQLDHVNGIRSDNRIANLRAVTSAENGKNKRMHKGNTSGATGVSWCKNSGKWKVSIRGDGRLCHIGNFTDFDAAVASRKKAEAEFRYHENHGRLA